MRVVCEEILLMLVLIKRTCLGPVKSEMNGAFLNNKCCSRPGEDLHTRVAGFSVLTCGACAESSNYCCVVDKEFS